MAMLKKHDLQVLSVYMTRYVDSMTHMNRALLADWTSYRFGWPRHDRSHRSRVRSISTQELAGRFLPFLSRLVRQLPMFPTETKGSKSSSPHCAICFFPDSTIAVYKYLPGSFLRFALPIDRPRVHTFLRELVRETQSVKCSIDQLPFEYTGCAIAIASACIPSTISSIALSLARTNS